MSQARRQAFAQQLQARNTFYYSFANNLAKAGHKDAADRVRALALQSGVETPGTFIRALMPELDEARVLETQLATDVMTMLRESGAGTADGKMPLLSYLRSCYQAAAVFEKMILDNLTTDDGAIVTPEALDMWRGEARELGLKVSKIMEDGSADGA